MDQEREKRYYTEKADRIDKKIASILNMESGDIITEEMRKQLGKNQQEARRVCQKLKNDEFEIAIVGLEKSGKSSFCNALIEKNLLPTAHGRCTYTATCIRYAQNDNAVISFYGLAEFQKDFADKLKKLGIKNPESYDYRSISEEKYKELYEQRAGNDDQFADTLNRDVQNIIHNKQMISEYLGHSDITYAGDELLQDKFQKFIREPSQAIAVKEIKIGSRALENMRNAIIYDVPGFNSPTEMHKEQTLQKMKSADAIVMVARGDEPSLTEDVLKISRESDSDGTKLSDKLFVFANKAERCDDFKEIQEGTWEEWIRKYSYVDEEEKDWRIIFGSANAHLQKCGQIEGDDYIRAVEKKELPNGDGIDYMKRSLEEYNKNYRFEVLKRRIDRLAEELKEVFKDVAQKYTNISGGDNPDFYNGHWEMAMELLAKVQKTIPDTLNEYMDEIKEKMREKPLSSHIKDRIEEIVSVEDYQITDEEIKKAHERVSRLGTEEQFNRVDLDIRSKRCDIMYDRFCDQIVNIALDRHKEYEENIVAKCLDAMGVPVKSGYRNELKEKLEKLLADVIGYGEGDYYQSLIERYSRDLYEILIYNQYNEQRLERFYADAENFYSLSIFYRPEHTESTDKENNPIYEDQAIKDMPMCRRLLFHSTNDGEDNTGRAYQKIKNFFSEYNEELYSLVKTLGSLAPMDVETIVSEICRFLNEGDESTRLVYVKEKIKGEIMERRNPENIYAADILNRKSFRMQYKKFHETRKQDYESIKRDFLDDMNILRDILCNAFVNAVNIEKPFLAKERKIIDDIISLTEKKEFRSFLSANMRLINDAEYAELDEMTARQRLNQACMNDIQELLKEIDGAI